MGDGWIALIAAGAAVAGGLVTGGFTHVAGVRRADAVLEAVLTAFRDQRTARELELRRGAYADFLAAAEVLVLTRRTRVGDASDLPALRRAFAAVLLAGPPETGGAARELVDLLGTGHGSLDQVEARREAFVTAARQALLTGAETAPEAVRAPGSGASVPPG